MNDKKQDETDVTSLDEKKRAEETQEVQEKTKKKELSPRQIEAKEKRSLASERSKTRMGLPPKPPKEEHSFDLERADEKEGENTPAPRIPPQRIMEFWTKVQRRQQEMLRRAGISTTTTKISNIQMLYDKNGKETSVKVSFAGGGSIEDAGNKIHVFHNMRRKKPRRNKLRSILQAIRERGWAAVQGDIPPELRALVLRVCKSMGIPLKTKAEVRNNVQGSRPVYSPLADVSLYMAGRESAYQKSNNYSNPYYNQSNSAYLNSSEYGNDSLISELFNHQARIAEAHKRCKDRARNLINSVFGKDEAVPSDAKPKEVYGLEALAFMAGFINDPNQTPQAYLDSLTKEQREQVCEHVKRLDTINDGVVRIQQIALTVDRCLKGTASEAEQKLFADIEAMTGKKVTSLSDLEALSKGQVNRLMQRFGRKGLPIDNMFKAENGFFKPSLPLGQEIDVITNSLLKKSKVQVDSLEELQSGFPKDFADLTRQSTQEAQALEAQKQADRERRSAGHEGQRGKKCPDFVKPADKLPDDKTVLEKPAGIAAYIGMSKQAFDALADKPNNHPAKKLFAQGADYYNMIKKDKSLSEEQLKEKMDTFLTSSPKQRHELREAELQRRAARKKSREQGNQNQPAEKTGQPKQPETKALAPSVEKTQELQVQPTEKMKAEVVKMAAANKDNKMSTMDMMAKMKKMQKKETAKKKPPSERRKKRSSKKDARGAQLQAYLLKQRAGGR